MKMRLIAIILVAIATAGHQAMAWTDPATRDPGAASKVESSTATSGASSERAPQEVRRVSLLIKGTNDHEWSRFGFTDEELARAITERLARTGIEVAPAARDVPVLEIDAHVNDQTVNNSYIVYIRLKDRLPLPQNPDGFVTRTVWSDWKLGAFEPHNYRKLRAAILELVDVFAGQHLLTR